MNFVHVPKKKPIH